MTKVSMLSAAAPPLSLLEGSSLFLDFDGTLVEIAETPEAVVVGKPLRAVVRRLQKRLHGRLALISGRPSAQVRRLVVDHLNVIGSHGMEFVRADGSAFSAERPSALTEVLSAMQDLASRRPGLIVEDKPLGVALHYRQRPSAESECIEWASDLAGNHALHLQLGKMMVEVRAGGGDKGTAIRTFMREPQMVGTCPVFMGDDLTDEPGFAAVAELGGAGILVGEARETAARYRVAGVGAALAWLEAASAKSA